MTSSIMVTMATLGIDFAMVVDLRCEFTRLHLFEPWSEIFYCRTND
jgi:hypothetical protein